MWGWPLSWEASWEVAGLRKMKMLQEAAAVSMEAGRECGRRSRREAPRGKAGHGTAEAGRSLCVLEQMIQKLTED